MAGTAADSQYVWVNGKHLRYTEANVHVLSHSLHYGCAVFEGIRAYQTPEGNAAAFRLREHFERFFNSLKVLDYHTPFGVEDLIEATRSLIRANNFKQCYVRPIALIDDAVRGLELPKEPKASICIAAWYWGKYMGDEGQQKGIRVGVSSLRWPSASTTMPWAKVSGNYLLSVLARREAILNGYDEAILLDPEGYVAEGPGENIFMVKNKILLTPPATHVMPGITRDSIIRIARDLGYSVREENIIRNELYVADEIFFTGTAVEVTPIREVDHYTIGNGQPGPITCALLSRYFEAVRGERPEYLEWLTEV